MATKYASNTAAAEREHHRTNLWAQLARFIGLFLAPFLGLLVSWLIHLWVVGIAIHWASIDWEVRPSPAAVTVAVFCSALLTGYLAYLGWGFAAHRKDELRRALVTSILIIGALFTINVGTGPHFWWSPLCIIGGWFVAVIWSLARLDVTRNDKTNDEGEKEGFLEKHGLKGWFARKVTPIADDKGEPLATEIEFQHAEGDTVEQLQDAVPAFESGTASPRGMSTATGTDRADRSVMTIMHRDPLIQKQPLPEPSSPGGSIADGMMIGTYARGMKVMVYIGGPSPRMPDGPASPSNILFMGMTRAGKTVAENEMITEMATRRDVVILYLNKSKGMQDWRPISPSTEVSVIEADADTGGKYRMALKQVEKIMAHRQRQLGLFAMSAWSADECFHNPPWRTDNATGKRVRMEPMPKLYAHIGEADSILKTDGFQVQSIASKCLSLGVVLGISMQRADHAQMPTGLRFNLGTSLCFGCSDDASAGFALSDETIKAGAHPENWKQRKPGYFYYEGLGIDDTLFPVPARTFSGEGKNELIAQLLKRNLEWAPRMAKLDAGSAAATDYEVEEVKDGKKVKRTVNWWREMTAETDRVRAMLLGQPAPVLPEDEEGDAELHANPSATTHANPSANPVQVDDEYTAELHAVRAQLEDDDEGGFAFGLDEDEEEIMQELDREMRQTTHVEGVELYPVDPITGERPTIEDATAPLGTVAPDNNVTWGDDKPAPRDRAAAVAALFRAFNEMVEDPTLRDPEDPTGNTVIITPGMTYDRYEFRSRPWFTEAFGQCARGELEIDGGLVLSYALDLGAAAGKYRLQRPAGDHRS